MSSEIKFTARDGQDKWVLEKLDQKTHGYFVDIGASGGIKNSNTYVLEKHFDWSGICVEANPKFRAFEALVSNRNCICENICVYSSSGTVDFLARGRRVEASGIYGDFASQNIKNTHEKHHHPLIEMPSITLLDLLKKHSAPTIIDYLSVDTEGSEWEILKDFDFDKYTFLIIHVEHNYIENSKEHAVNKSKRDNIRDLLKNNGYVLSKEVICDDWFVHKSIYKEDHKVEKKFWSGKFTHEIKKHYKISFCVTCMGRLYNLKETLLKNIEDNKDYPNVEFVVLDYNSNDGLGEWMKQNVMEHIKSGRVAYYRTNEPKYFSMGHSRNIAFKVATGDIVNNLDADNYTFNPDKKMPECWAAYLNRMANDCSEKVIFAKGKSGMRGRIGFYRKEFIDILGGYDEDLLGYGHDDHDLVCRAWALGFTMYWWGGKYYNRIKTSRQERNQNMERKWKITENENKIKSAENLKTGIFRANAGKHWGKAKLIKNFLTEIEV